MLARMRLEEKQNDTKKGTDMISFKHTGDFKMTRDFLGRSRADRIRKTLEKYGAIGVKALYEATPKDTGKTAASWSYDVAVTDKQCAIRWNNSNFVDGVPIALVIQYGHALPNGRFIEGRDYINPTMKPIFDEILEKVWKEVTG